MAKPRRKKLRRLTVVDLNIQSTKIRRNFFKVIFFGFLTAVTVVAIMTNLDISNFMWKEFQTTYRKQYNQIIHGRPDYCRPIIDSHRLFVQIGNEQTILNQADALAELEIALRNESGLTAVAVVGPSGVGKSLFAMALKNNFPWKENVQAYSWSNLGHDKNKNYQVIHKFIDNFSDCGQNLVLIDNLSINDKHLIEGFNRKIQNVTGAKNCSKKVVIFYIISLPSFIAPEHPKIYYDHYIDFQNLYKTKTVNFRQFTVNDIKDCIWYEAKQANLTLDEVTFQNILESIDPIRSGCKNVYAKLLLYL